MIDVWKLMDGIPMTGAATSVEAIRALLLVTVAALAIGSITVSRREYVLAA